MNKLATDLSSVTRVGLDLAKHIFHVHAADASGRVVVARALRRREVVRFFASLPPCLNYGANYGDTCNNSEIDHVFRAC